MPRPSITITREITQTVDVSLRPHVRQMVKARCEEYAKLNKTEKDAKARKKRIESEIDSVMTAEGAGEALLDGTNIDGHRMKIVVGSTTRMNWDKLKRKFGLTEADLESCRESTDNTPFVRIKAPGEKHSEDEG